MAYETKVILTLLANCAAKADSVEEVYDAIRSAANVEGLVLPSYDELAREVRKTKH
jgi:hypothetical protein